MKRILLLCALLATLWPVFATAQFSADISLSLSITCVDLTSTNYLDAGALTNFPTSKFYCIRLVP